MRTLNQPTGYLKDGEEFRYTIHNGFNGTMLNVARDLDEAQRFAVAYSAQWEVGLLVLDWKRQRFELVAP